MRSEYDIIIVGASVAGASSAIALARDGYRILLLDQAVFPRDKPCGEGIMPQGVRVLAELGVLPDILVHRGGNRFRGIRYRNRAGVSAEADFAPTRAGDPFGVVIRRWYLDDLLLQRAKSLPNVTVREGFRVTQVLQDGDMVKGVAGHVVEPRAALQEFAAPLTLAADGRHSVFHAACGLSKTYLARRRFGVTGHLAGVEVAGSHVEVLVHPEGEIYIAPCGDDLTLVALLLEAKSMRRFAGDLSGRYLDFLLSAEGFRERVSRSELVGSVFAVGPLGFTIAPCHRPGLLLIGDSAGFLDPITGEGMTLALRSVQATVPLISEAFAAGTWGAQLGRQYAHARFRLMEDLFRFTLLLLRLSRYKGIADRAIRRLSRDGALFQKLLGIVTGTRSYSDLSLADKRSMLLG